MRALYIFTHDLRTHDNVLLQALSEQAKELICVYILDQRFLSANYFQQSSLGRHRQRFLQQSLQDLQHQLQRYNQRLIVKVGDSKKIIPQLAKRYSIDVVGLCRHPGIYETDLYHAVYDQGLNILPNRYTEQFTLLREGQLAIDIDDMPMSFSTFRKKIEPVECDLPVVFSGLPPMPVIAHNEQSEPLPFVQSMPHQYALPFVGGETAGLKQLHYYCHQSRLSHYKATRNQLEGWDFSSKLSPWLANGSLSPRTAWHAIKDFEREYGANDSTYWLGFELLWREYFQWLLYSQGRRFFRLSGLGDKKPLVTFYPQEFKAWVEGNTGFMGVDAAMKQLKYTGWMSNRARQWAASCLIHELGVDWRYGAAHFEHQLIDFDVASNWGNWLYLAGVGTDPRGSRRFNLEQQLKDHDPDQQFVKRWSAIQ